MARYMCWRQSLGTCIHCILPKEFSVVRDVCLPILLFAEVMVAAKGLISEESVFSDTLYG